MAIVKVMTPNLFSMPTEQIDTIVGANVELTGSLRNHGPIQIHGRINGDISSDSLVVVGESAVISGPITAKQVDISGQVHGSITAEEQIELQPKSFVQGDISCSRLSIRPGATFIGKSQMNAPLDANLEGLAPEDKKKPRLEIE